MLRNGVGVVALDEKGTLVKIWPMFAISWSRTVMEFMRTVLWDKRADEIASCNLDAKMKWYKK